MTAFLGGNPLSYEGVKATNPCQVIQALRNPLTSDTGYDIGTMWVNTVTATIFFLGRLSGGTASWVNTVGLLLAAPAVAPAPAALAPTIAAQLPKLKDKPVEAVSPKAEPVSQKHGQVSLTAGRTTVVSSEVKANSKITLKRESNGSSSDAQLGELKVGTINPDHSFVINSFLPPKSVKLASSDFSVVSWTIN
jgi:hypothetical protein